MECGMFITESEVRLERILSLPIALLAMELARLLLNAVGLGACSTSPRPEISTWKMYFRLLSSISINYYVQVWGWVADHDIDKGSNLNVYNTRGLLCESQGPVWMYGTAMEHSVLYQYNLYGAKNIFMGAIQTETPYYQPSKNTPFATTDKRDPPFCTNDARYPPSFFN